MLGRRRRVPEPVVRQLTSHGGEDACLSSDLHQEDARTVSFLVIRASQGFKDESPSLSLPDRDEERIRNPEPNWGPYRHSNGILASMRNYIHALENRLLLSRVGWSAKLLEELFGSNLMNGQW